MASTVDSKAWLTSSNSSLSWIVRLKIARSLSPAEASEQLTHHQPEDDSMAGKADAGGQPQASRKGNISRRYGNWSSGERDEKRFTPET